jgi:DNA repair protein RadC
VEIAAGLRGERTPRGVRFVFYDDEKAAALARQLTAAGYVVSYGPERSMAAEEEHCPCAHMHPASVPSTPCPGDALAAEVSEQTTVEIVYRGQRDASFEKAIAKHLGRSFDYEERYTTEGSRAPARRRMNVIVYDFPTKSEAERFERWALDTKLGPENFERISVYPKHAFEQKIRGRRKLSASELPVVERDASAVAKGRRLAALSNARAVYDFVSVHVEKLSQEVVLVCPVDLRRKPLAPKPFMVAMGQRAEVQVDEADALRPVGDTNAAGVVYAHNHPSGDCTPSESDKRLTKQLKKSLATAYPSVAFLDHVILGHSEYYSFTEGKSYKV